MLFYVVLIDKKSGYIQLMYYANVMSKSFS